MYLTARSDLALHPGSFVWSKEPGNVGWVGASGGDKLFTYFCYIIIHVICTGYFEDFWKATSACFKTIGKVYHGKSSR